MKKLTSIIWLVFISFLLQAQSIDLKGTWEFKMDPEDVGILENWQNGEFDEIINLPGSMATNGKGWDISVDTKWTGQIVDSAWFRDEKYAKYREAGNVKSAFWLQPNKSYVGAAWYKTKFNVSESQSLQNLTLILERPHWETTVWIDGIELGTQNSLSVPHNYDLGRVAHGEHTAVIRVNNRIKEINVGINAHSVSDHTQTNWNGIVGNISIVEKSSIYIESVKTFPNNDKKEVRLQIVINSTDNSAVTSNIKVNASSKFTPIIHDVAELSADRKIETGKNIVEITYPMGESFYQWDEFTPYLYELSVMLESNKVLDNYSTRFGMRKLEIEGTRFAMNDRPIFLRGALDCASFPLTGYPPMEKHEWKRIFNVVKHHGLNHVRFHSWCPPKAAFEAADELGIYIQAEGNSWTKVGTGSKFDEWIYEESERILDNYGNHPSFILYTHGNEPDGGNQGRFLGDLVNHLKSYDSRHLYTSGAGWPDIPENEFYNAMYPRLYVWGDGLKSHNNANPPSTDFDWNKIIEGYKIPYVSHEIGQWCVYPNFKEIDKYTGVLKAKNFEIFQETLNENGMAHLADSFLLASGLHQALTYKADIEAALRTDGFAGFQILGLNDFPGQGTALVGVLDAFWEEKGYISPEEFKQFSGQTVPLVRLPKMVYMNNEILTAQVEVSHFGEKKLTNVTPTWILKAKNGEIVAFGNLYNQNIPIGNCINLGVIEYALSNIVEPQVLSLVVEVAGNENNWDIWVYPVIEEEKGIDSDILIVDNISSKTISFLEKGGKVLLSPKKGSIKDEFGGDVVMGYSPIFWNTAWTRKQPPQVMGVLTDPNHPALKLFPTNFHSDFQWWPLMMNSNAINLNKLGGDIKPIVRVIDDWFTSESLGLIVEAKVGKGKIIISGVDLLNNTDNRPEIEQMKLSLLEYMKTDEFSPESIINIHTLKDMIN